MGKIVRILYVGQYFPPEVGAPPIRAVETVAHLHREGHDVVVLTGFPNYPTGVIAPDYRGRWFVREVIDGIPTLRCYLTASPRKTLWNRLLNYVSYVVSSAVMGTFFLRGPFDVVIGTSPPLFVGISAWWLSVRHRARFVFDVRDVWPEAPETMGEIRNPIVLRTMRWIADFLYWRAALITCANPGNDRVIADRLGSAGAKVTVVANGSNTQVFRPLTSDERCEVRSEVGVEAPFLAVYVGQHGLMYDLDVLVDVAAQFEGDTGIEFLFVGDGPTKPKLQRQASELSNIRFLPPHDAQDAARIVGAADVGLVSIRDVPFLRMVVPVKLYDYLACGIPVIHNCGGAAQQFVQESACGLDFPSRDVQALSDQIQRLRANPHERAAMGERGRRVIESRFSREAQGARFAYLLSELS